MLWQWSPSVVAELAASSILLVLAIYFPGRDLNRQARFTGITLVFVCALWILSHAFEIGVPSISYKEAMVGLQLVCGTIAMTFWLLYILHYLGPRKLLNRRIYIPFGIMPVIAILALLTNNIYGLMWTASGIDSQNPYLPLQPTYGVIYWACMVYVAILTLTGSFLITWNIVRRRYSYRRESIFLLIAAILPLITAFIEVTGLVSDLKLSVGLSSWTACIGTIIIILNLPKLHSEQIIPIARDIVFERIGDCILVLDMHNRVLDLNPAAEQLIGCRISDAIGLTIEKLWPYQSTPLTQAKEGMDLVLEKDGKQRAYALHISTINESGRGIISKVVLLTDITERKKAEESQQKEHLMLERTERLALIGSWEWNIATDTVIWSDELFRIFQRDPQEGAPSFAQHPAFYQPDDMERLKQAVAAAVADGTPYEIELRAIRKDGETRICIARGVAERAPNGRVIRLFGSLQDITERKRAEKELRETEERFRVAQEMSPDGFTILHPLRNEKGEVVDFNWVYENKTIARINGTDPEEVRGKRLLDLFPTHKGTSIFEAYIHVSNSGKPQIIEEVYAGEVVSKPTWLRLVVVSMGEDIAILAQDITERKLAEKALRDNEAQYRLLADHTEDLVWLMDMNLKSLYVSPSTEKVSGFTIQERMELTMEQSLTPESLKLASDLFLKELPILEADPDYNPVRTLELEFYRKDGTTVWTESKFSLIRDENGRALSVLAEARDITERKLNEEKLQRSYESLKKTLNDAIATMAKIVETRDPYTAGHQQRVSDLANAIAMEMKLEYLRIDQIRMAAVIHDIGKMYVPADILSKPGKLSTMEFNLIKTHAQAGYDIMKGMDFPYSVAQAILQHHERTDGSGYPNRLKGDDIILEAKILAVADVVEAMSSHRPYRAALGIDKALEEISHNRGTLYDPDVVDVCTQLFHGGKFEFKSV